MKDQTVIVKKVLNASCEEVFDAWLDPEGLREWMRPGPVTDCKIEMDPRIGGGFRIIMVSPGGEVVNTGTYRILDRPVKLQFTWISSRWKNQETLITVELSQNGSGCEMILTHSQFPGSESAEQLVLGWNALLERLSWLLTSQKSFSTQKNEI